MINDIILPLSNPVPNFHFSIAFSLPKTIKILIQVNHLTLTAFVCSISFFYVTPPHLIRERQKNEQKNKHNFL